MFSYLRYVYAISFVLIVIGALGVGMVIRTLMSEGLETIVLRDNTSLAQSYINMVWEPFRVSSQRGAPYETQNFAEQSKAFVSRLTASRFAVYGVDGKRLFISHVSELYDANGTIVELTATNPVFGGKPSNHLLNGMTLVGNTTTSDMAVIQSFLPIPNPYYNPSAAACSNNTTGKQFAVCVPTMGAIEVVTDITQQWGQLNTVQIMICGSIIGIFILLILMLMFTTQRAEAIIAKQHEVNLELTAAAASAEAENRDKSQFLANISHELRTPLNAIIGFSEIIKKEAITDLRPTHQEYIRDIHGSGIHLLSLINDILDFSKAEAGKLELEISELDLSKLIINSMRLVIPRAENAQVMLVEDLPTEHIVCRTDGKKLKQVLLNLLSNAVKFTPAGGEVRVSAWEQVVDHKVCIQVKDTGIGIAPKDIAKVMMPFGQVDNKLSRKYEGTGLGLPLSKKFIEILGGEFHIESVVDKGTTITIRLPGVKRSEGIQLQRDGA